MSVGARRGAMMASMEAGCATSTSRSEDRPVHGGRRSRWEWPLMLCGRTRFCAPRRCSTVSRGRPTTTPNRRLFRPDQRPQPRELGDRLHSTGPYDEQQLRAKPCPGGLDQPDAAVRAAYPQAFLDEVELADLAAVAICFMENTIDASGFPLEARHQEPDRQTSDRVGDRPGRRADHGRPTLPLDGSIGRGRGMGPQISRAACLTFAHLAREKGASPLFDRDAYLLNETVSGLDEDLRALIATNGIRNALLTSVAATGTIRCSRSPTPARCCNRTGHGWRKKCPATRRGASRRPA